MIEEATRAKPDDPAPWLLLSSYRGRIGDLTGALEAADRALAVAPGDAVAKLRRAELLIDIGFREHDDARVAEGRGGGRRRAGPGGRQARSACSCSPRSTSREQRYEDAVAALRRALDARPDWPQAHFLLGTALLFQGDLAGARGEIARSLELDPNFVEALQAARARSRQARRPRARRRGGRRALARDPDRRRNAHPAGAEPRAGSALRRGARPAARDPRGEARRRRQFRARPRGRFREAMATTRANTSSSLSQPSRATPRCWRALMQVDARQGKLGDADARIRAARDANPTDARLHLLFGEAALCSGRQAGRCRGGLSQGHRARPERARGLRQPGRPLHRDRPDADEAIATYETALEQNPNSGPAPASSLGSLYEAQRPPRGGDGALRGRRSSSIPSFAIAKNNLAYLMAEHGAEPRPRARPRTGGEGRSARQPERRRHAGLGALQEEGTRGGDRLPARGGRRAAARGPAAAARAPSPRARLRGGEQPEQATEALDQAVADLEARNGEAAGRERRPDPPWAERDPRPAGAAPRPVLSPSIGVKAGRLAADEPAEPVRVPWRACGPPEGEAMSRRCSPIRGVVARSRQQRRRRGAAPRPAARAGRRGRRGREPRGRAERGRRGSRSERRRASGSLRSAEAAAAAAPEQSAAPAAEAAPEAAAAEAKPRSPRMALGPIGHDAQGQQGRIHVVQRATRSGTSRTPTSARPGCGRRSGRTTTTIRNPHRIFPGDKLCVSRERDAQALPRPRRPRCWPRGRGRRGTRGAGRDGCDAGAAAARRQSTTTPTSTTAGFVTREQLRGRGRRSSTARADACGSASTTSVIIGFGEGEVQVGDQFYDLPHDARVEDPETGMPIGYATSRSAGSRSPRSTPESSMRADPRSRAARSGAATTCCRAAMRSPTSRSAARRDRSRAASSTRPTGAEMVAATTSSTWTAATRDGLSDREPARGLPAARRPRRIDSAQNQERAHRRTT